MIISQSARISILWILIILSVNFGVKADEPNGAHEPTEMPGGSNKEENKTAAVVHTQSEDSVQLTPLVTSNIDESSGNHGNGKDSPLHNDHGILGIQFKSPEEPSMDMSNHDNIQPSVDNGHTSTNNKRRLYIIPNDQNNRENLPNDMIQLNAPSPQTPQIHLIENGDSDGHIPVDKTMNPTISEAQNLNLIDHGENNVHDNTMTMDKKNSETQNLYQMENGESNVHTPVNNMMPMIDQSQNYYDTVGDHTIPHGNNYRTQNDQAPYQDSQTSGGSDTSPHLQSTNQDSQFLGGEQAPMQQSSADTSYVVSHPSTESQPSTFSSSDPQYQASHSSSGPQTSSESLAYNQNKFQSLSSPQTSQPQFMASKLSPVSHLSLPQQHASEIQNVGSEISGPKSSSHQQSSTEPHYADPVRSNEPQAFSQQQRSTDYMGPELSTESKPSMNYKLTSDPQLVGTQMHSATNHGHETEPHYDGSDTPVESQTFSQQQPSGSQSVDTQHTAEMHYDGSTFPAGSHSNQQLSSQPQYIGSKPPTESQLTSNHHNVNAQNMGSAISVGSQTSSHQQSNDPHYMGSDMPSGSSPSHMSDPHYIGQDMSSGSQYVGSEMSSGSQHAGSVMSSGTHIATDHTAGSHHVSTDMSSGSHHVGTDMSSGLHHVGTDMSSGSHHVGTDMSSGLHHVGTDMSSGSHHGTDMSSGSHHVGTDMSSGSHHVGTDMSSGLHHVGTDMSSGSHHVGTDMSSGSQHVGADMSSGSHHGTDISSGSHHVGTDMSSGSHHVGTDMSSGSHHVGTDMSSGSHHVGTDMSSGSHHGTDISSGSHHVGTDMSSGSHHVGTDMSSGSHHVGTDMSSGSHHVGTDMSSGSHYVGTDMSSGSHHVGTDMSSGSHHAGTDMSSGSHHVGTDMSSGSHHVGTDMSSGSQHGTDMSAGSQHVGTDMSSGSHHVGTDISSGSQHVGTDISSGPHHVNTDLASGSQYVVSDMSSGTQNEGTDMSSGPYLSTELSPGSHHVGTDMSSGSHHVGTDMSSGSQHVITHMSSGSNQMGADLATGAQYKGPEASSGSQNLATDLSSGTQFADAHMSSGSQYVGSETSAGSQNNVADMSSGSQRLGTDKSSGSHHVGTDMSSGSEYVGSPDMSSGSQSGTGMHSGSQHGTDMSSGSHVGAGISAGSHHPIADMSSGSQHVSTEMSSGSQYVGNDMSSGTHHVGAEMSSGSQYVGPHMSSGTQHVGEEISSGSQYVGPDMSPGTHNVGAEMSSGSQYVGPDMSSGTQHVGKEISSGTQHVGAEMSSGSQNVGPDMSPGTHHVGAEMSSGSQYVGPDMSSGSQHVITHMSSGSNQMGADLATGAQYKGPEASSGSQNLATDLSSGTQFADAHMSSGSQYVGSETSAGSQNNVADMSSGSQRLDTDKSSGSHHVGTDMFSGSEYVGSPDMSSGSQSSTGIHSGSQHGTDMSSGSHVGAGISAGSHHPIADMSSGSQHVSTEMSSGSQYVGNDMSSGTHHVGAEMSSGSQYVGPDMSSGTQHVGEEISSGSQYVGPDMSPGTHNVGAEMSSGSQYVGPDMSSGTQHMGAEMSSGTKHVGAEMSSGSQNVGPDMSPGTHHVGAEMSSGSQYVGPDMSPGTQHVGAEMSSGSQYVGPDMSPGTQHVGAEMSSGTQNVGAEMSSGSQNVGPDMSPGTHHVGAEMSSGSKYVGPDMSPGTQHVGAEMSSGSQYVGPDMSLGTQHVGAEMSSGSQYVGPDMSAGTQQVSSDISSGSQSVGPDMSARTQQVSSDISSGSQSVGPDMSAGIQYVGSDMSSGTQHVGVDMSSGSQHVSTDLSSGAKYVGSDMSSGTQHAGSDMSSGTQSLGSQNMGTDMSSGSQPSSQQPTDQYVSPDLSSGSQTSLQQQQPSGQYVAQDLSSTGGQTIPVQPIVNSEYVHPDTTLGSLGTSQQASSYQYTTSDIGSQSSAAQIGSHSPSNSQAYVPSQSNHIPESKQSSISQPGGALSYKTTPRQTTANSENHSVGTLSQPSQPSVGTLKNTYPTVVPSGPSVQISTTKQSSTDTGCRKMIDMVIVADGPGDKVEFQTLQAVFSKIVESMDVDSDKVNLAFVVQSGYDQTESIKLSGSNDELQNAIHDLQEPSDGERLDLAIKQMKVLFRNSSRNAATQVGIIIVKDNSKYPTQTAKRAAYARLDGIILYVIGVGDNIEMSEMKSISSFLNPILTVKDYEDLYYSVEDYVKLFCVTTEEYNTQQTNVASTFSQGTVQEVPKVYEKTTTTTAAPDPMSEIIAMCGDFMIQNGPGSTSHRSDCNKYISCSENPDGSIKADIVACNFGEFWNPSTSSCKKSNQVICMQDPCVYAKGMLSSYAYPGNCRAYWQCGSVTRARCCGSGWVYIKGEGCVQDLGNTCTSPCQDGVQPVNTDRPGQYPSTGGQGGTNSVSETSGTGQGYKISTVTEPSVKPGPGFEPPTTAEGFQPDISKSAACNKGVVMSDPSKYSVNDMNMGYLEKQCPPGREFDPNTCLCSVVRHDLPAPKIDLNLQCAYQTQSSYVADPTDGSKYIQCTIQPDQTMIASSLSCPFGQMWDEPSMSCLDVRIAKNRYDLCAMAEGMISFYSFSGNCRAYYHCGETTEILCCTGGRKYKEGDGCVLDTDNSCTQVCQPLPDNQPGCMRRPVPTDKSSFELNMGSMRWVWRSCEVGTEYNHSDCECVPSKPEPTKAPATSCNRIGDPADKTKYTVFDSSGWTQHICPAGMEFNEAFCKCTAITSPPRQPTQGCNRRPHAIDSTKYEQLSPLGWVQETCEAGMEYNADTCGCSLITPKVLPNPECHSRPNPSNARYYDEYIEGVGWKSQRCRREYEYNKASCKCAPISASPSVDPNSGCKRRGNPMDNTKFEEYGPSGWTQLSCQEGMEYDTENCGCSLIVPPVNTSPDCLRRAYSLDNTKYEEYGPGGWVQQTCEEGMEYDSETCGCSVIIPSINTFPDCLRRAYSLDNTKYEEYGPGGWVQQTCEEGMEYDSETCGCSVIIPSINTFPDCLRRAYSLDNTKYEEYGPGGWVQQTCEEGMEYDSETCGCSVIIPSVNTSPDCLRRAYSLDNTKYEEYGPGGWVQQTCEEGMEYDSETCSCSVIIPSINTLPDCLRRAYSLDNTKYEEYGPGGWVQQTCEEGMEYDSETCGCSVIIPSINTFPDCLRRAYSLDNTKYEEYGPGGWVQQTCEEGMEYDSETCGCSVIIPSVNTSPDCLRRAYSLDNTKYEEYGPGGWVQQTCEEGMEYDSETCSCSVIIPSINTLPDCLRRAYSLDNTKYEEYGQGGWVQQTCEEGMEYDSETCGCSVIIPSVNTSPDCLRRAYSLDNTKYEQYGPGGWVQKSCGEDMEYDSETCGCSVIVPPVKPNPPNQGCMMRANTLDNTKYEEYGPSGWTPQSCQEGMEYVAEKCGCSMIVPPVNPYPDCNRRALAGDSRRYEEYVVPLGWMPRVCGDGYEYSYSLCECTPVALPSGPDAGTPVALPSGPDTGTPVAPPSGPDTGTPVAPPSGPDTDYPVPPPSGPDTDCNKRPHSGDVSRYEQYDTVSGWTPQACDPGYEFSSSLCSCLPALPPVVPDIPSKDCKRRVSATDSTKYEELSDSGWVEKSCGEGEAYDRVVCGCAKISARPDPTQVTIKCNRRAIASNKRAYQDYVEVFGWIDQICKEDEEYQQDQCGCVSAIPSLLTPGKLGCDKRAVPGYGNQYQEIDKSGALTKKNCPPGREFDPYTCMCTIVVPVQIPSNKDIDYSRMCASLSGKDSGLTGNPLDSTQYIQCEPQPDETFIASILNCPFGQMWSREKNACYKSYLVKNVFDLCQYAKGMITSYSFHMSCRAFFSCEEATYMKCCEPGMRYVEEKGCVPDPDNSCLDVCPTDCLRRAISGETSVYEEFSAEYGWDIQTCSEGMEYNANLCNCAVPSTSGMPSVKGCNRRGIRTDQTRYEEFRGSLGWIPRGCALGYQYNPQICECSSSLPTNGCNRRANPADVTKYFEKEGTTWVEYSCGQNYLYNHDICECSPINTFIASTGNFDLNRVCVLSDILYGTGYSSHPTDCSRYLRCSQRLDKSISAELMECPFGEYWDQQILSCRESYKVPCKNDKCMISDSHISSYAYHGNCRAYWECGTGTYIKCCAIGYVYKEKEGCVVDQANKCDMECPPKVHSNKFKCDKRGFSIDSTRYEQLMPGYGYVKQKCAHGTLFDQISCGCSHYAPYISPTELDKEESRIACEGCKMSNGAGFNNHPYDCTRFVQCFVQPDSTYRAVFKDCPYGMFWNQEILTCEESSMVKCETDPCVLNKLLNHYADVDNCGGFWECRPDGTYIKCCLDGQVYLEGMGCVLDEEKLCNTSCPPEEKYKPGKCNKQADKYDKTKFYEEIVGHDVVPRICAPGTEFNILECLCTFPEVTTSVDYQPTRHDCKPDLRLEFNNGLYDSSGKWTYVNNEGVIFTNGTAYFNGRSRLLIPQYTNAELGDTFVMRIRYKGNGTYANPDSLQALINNGDCGDDGSVQIYTAQTEVGFSVQTKNQEKVTFRVPKPSTDWKNVEFEFTGNRLEGKVNGLSGFGQARGDIDTRHCALQIGFGFGYQNFVGFVDTVEVYKCKPQTPMVWT